MLTTLNEAESLWHLAEMLPKEAIQEIAQSGQNDEMAFFWRHKMNLEIPTKTCIEWLKEEGAWTLEELEQTLNEELNIMVLWLAAWLAKEEL